MNMFQDIQRAVKPMVYDFEIADNASELVRVLNYINRHGYQLVAVSPVRGILHSFLREAG